MRCNIARERGDKAVSFKLRGEAALSFVQTARWKSDSPRTRQRQLAFRQKIGLPACPNISAAGASVARGRPVAAASRTQVNRWSWRIIARRRRSDVHRLRCERTAATAPTQ